VSAKQIAMAALDQAKDAVIEDVLEKSLSGLVRSSKSGRCAELLSELLRVRFRLSASQPGSDEAVYWAVELESEKLALEHAIDSERILVEVAARKAFLDSVDVVLNVAGQMASRLLPILLKGLV